MGKKKIIQELCKNGTPTEEIARMANCSLQYIYNTRSKDKNIPKPKDLLKIEAIKASKSGFIKGYKTLTETVTTISSM